VGGNASRAVRVSVAMAGKRRVDPRQGREALVAWTSAGDAGVPRETLATAVRFTLEELAELEPGRSVEVRVPPFGAVQCIEGQTHRRGTPPAVIETDAQSWLALATGALSWTDAVAAGRVDASGVRADLAALLPLPPMGETQGGGAW
jgi:hypothetical protein